MSDRVPVLSRVVTRFGIASLLSLVMVASSGCIPMVSYTRDDEIVARAGVQAAQTELSDLFYRAIDPAVSAVEFTDVMVKLSANQPIFGPYGIQVGATPITFPIVYQRIDRIEVYENSKIFIYGPGGVLERQILFPVIEDAKRCAQLLLSFKATAGHATPAGAGQPGA